MFLRVLGENHVRGPKLIYEHVLVGNVQENITKDHPRVFDPSWWPKLSKIAQPMVDNRRLAGHSMPLWWCIDVLDIIMDKERQTTSLSPIPWTTLSIGQRTGRHLPTLCEHVSLRRFTVK